ncbi:MAG: monomeric [FeFe] hydrogenase [Peptococcaceae bacterium]|nr:monomeric [FeFe] hydrogenase [Peptococcaceae bacterium]
MKNLFDTDVQLQKNRTLTAVAKLAFARNLDAVHLMNVSRELIPDGSEPTMRCCIYKERAISDEYVKLAIGDDTDYPQIVNVISIACDECPLDGMTVTDNCRGCLAHRCMNNCPKDAITIGEDHRAHIDHSKCINCGRCAASCPYSAIVMRKRPCIEACKPKALASDSVTKRAVIDEKKCISCGQCVYQCPFGAIVDKSFITDAIRLILASENNSKYHVYAIVAPSIASQYDTLPDVSTEKVVTGIKNLGFHAVLEAAWGADMVAYMEAQELVEKGFLTSSCCPGFVNYIHNNYPEIVPDISHNLSPMAQLGKVLKQMDPGCKTVFIGPCIAKKNEMLRVREHIDAVITFEELQALFTAKETNLAELEETALDNASYFGRIFARSGGLSEAVAQALKERDIPEDQFKAEPIICNGLKECDLALKRRKINKLPNNFIEGMCCDGGCIGGPGCINHNPKDAKEITKYGQSAVEQTIKSSIAVLDGFEEV